MANAYQSISSGLGILKNFYQGPIVDQFNEEVNIYRGAAKGVYPWSGLQVNRPLKVRRNPGIGATSDGGNLPQGPDQVAGWDFGSCSRGGDPSRCCAGQSV